MVTVDKVIQFPLKEFQSQKLVKINIRTEQNRKTYLIAITPPHSTKIISILIFTMIQKIGSLYPTIILTVSKLNFQFFICYNFSANIQQGDFLVFYKSFQFSLTVFKLYHGFSSVSYQYYWSIYPDTSQSVVMLSSKKGSHYYHF